MHQDSKAKRRGSGAEGRGVRAVQIELCDKLKALDMLAGHLGHVPDTRKARSSPEAVRSIADLAGASSWLYWLA
jgi:hypothetical protein